MIDRTAAEQLIDQQAMSGEFIRSPPKVQEIVALLTKLQAIDVASYKAMTTKINRKFDAEQSKDKIQRLLSDKAEGIRHLIELHGCLSQCTKKLKEHIPGLKVHTQDHLSGLVDSVVAKAKSEIATRPTPTSAGSRDSIYYASSLGIENVAYFQSIVAILTSSIAPAVVDGWNKELNDAAIQSANDLIKKMNEMQPPWASAPTLSFMMMKLYRVFILLEHRTLFREHFTKKFESERFSNESKGKIGSQINVFMTEGLGEVKDAAKQVIVSIGGFETYEVADYNKKANAVTKELAIDRLVIHSVTRPGHEPTRRTLHEAFKGFSSVYDGAVNDIGNRRFQPNENLSAARRVAICLESKRLFMKPRDVGRLLGHIGAQMTFSKVKPGARVTPGSLWAPHSTQLLGTFLLAGLAENDTLQNHMVRCLTGEGKSMCLALTSTLFAMLKYDVKVRLHCHEVVLSRTCSPVDL